MRYFNRLKNDDGYGLISWKIGPFQWIPEHRQLNLLWIKNGEWQSRTLITLRPYQGAI